MADTIREQQAWIDSRNYELWGDKAEEIRKADLDRLEQLKAETPRKKPRINSISDRYNNWPRQ